MMKTFDRQRDIMIREHLQGRGICSQPVLKAMREVPEDLCGVRFVQLIGAAGWSVIEQH
jgi:hypothetical protein